MKDYWTCPKCGANNDKDEKCDCGYRQIYSENICDRPALEQEMFKNINGIRQ